MIGEIIHRGLNDQVIVNSSNGSAGQTFKKQTSQCLADSSQSDSESSEITFSKRLLINNKSVEGINKVLLLSYRSVIDDKNCDKIYSDNKCENQTKLPLRQQQFNAKKNIQSNITSSSNVAEVTGISIDVERELFTESNHLIEANKEESLDDKDGEMISIHKNPIDLTSKSYVFSSDSSVDSEDDKRDIDEQSKNHQSVKRSYDVCRFSANNLNNAVISESSDVCASEDDESSMTTSSSVPENSSDAETESDDTGTVADRKPKTKSFYKVFIVNEHNSSDSDSHSSSETDASNSSSDNDTNTERDCYDNTEILLNQSSDSNVSDDQNDEIILKHIKYLSNNESYETDPYTNTEQNYSATDKLNTNMQHQDENKENQLTNIATAAAHGPNEIADLHNQPSNTDSLIITVEKDIACVTQNNENINFVSDTRPQDTILIAKCETDNDEQLNNEILCDKDISTDNAICLKEFKAFAGTEAVSTNYDCIEVRFFFNLIFFI